MQILEAAQQDK